MTTDTGQLTSVNVSFLRALLQDFRAARATYCRTEVSAQWGIALPFEQGVRFHYVARGFCWLRAERMRPVELTSGDLALLPHGTRHVIASSAEGPAKTLPELGPEQVNEAQFRLNLRPGGDASLIQCCTVGFADPLAKLLITAMPPALVLRGERRRDSALAALLAIMDRELTEDRAGADGIRARLADAAISMILRDWAETSPQRPGWLRKEADPRVLRALQSVQQRPEHGWSLAELAKVAGMSRTAFVEAFTAMTGTTPGRFVSEHRMELASRLLREKRLSLAQIATTLGYSGAAAFSRAFRRHAGRPPSLARRGA